jgi:glycosyltransferase involved in cell wall biosynthesis
VGDGPLQKDIAAKAQALGLEDYVIFAGERTDVAQLMLGAMDVFLLPSLHEGLGIVLIEAQAAGLPCIFSDVVPEEVDVIKPLMQRISLTASASVWAEATLKARSLKEKLDRPSILTSLEHSQFNIEVSSKKLAEVYESKSSHY